MQLPRTTSSVNYRAIYPLSPFSGLESLNPRPMICYGEVLVLSRDKGTQRFEAEIRILRKEINYTKIERRGETGEKLILLSRLGRLDNTLYFS